MAENVFSISSSARYIYKSRCRFMGLPQSVEPIIAGGGFLFLTSNPDRLQHIDKCGKIVRFLELPDEPWGMCVYGEDLVAITLPCEHKISAYKISDLSLSASIDTEVRCYRICRLNNNFYVTTRNTIKSYTDSGDITHESSPIFRAPYYITPSSNEEYLFVSDWMNHRIVALNRDLVSLLFTIQHDELRHPLGLCVNRFSNRLYVCCRMVDKPCVTEWSMAGEYVSTVINTRHEDFLPPHIEFFDTADSSRVPSLFHLSLNAIKSSRFRGYELYGSATYPRALCFFYRGNLAVVFSYRNTIIVDKWQGYLSLYHWSHVPVPPPSPPRHEIA